MSPVQVSTAALAPRDALRTAPSGTRGTDASTTSFGDVFRRHAERPAGTGPTAAGGLLTEADADATVGASGTAPLHEEQDGTGISAPPVTATHASSALSGAPIVGGQVVDPAMPWPAGPSAAATAVTAPSDPAAATALTAAPVEAGSAALHAEQEAVPAPDASDTEGAPIAAAPSAVPAQVAAQAAAATMTAASAPTEGETGSATAAAPAATAQAPAPALTTATGSTAAAAVTSGGAAESSAAGGTATPGAAGQASDEAARTTAPSAAPAIAAEQAEVTQPPAVRADVPPPAQQSQQSQQITVVSPAEVPPPTRQAPVPMPQQLGAPAFALARSAAESSGGTHTITVTVAPDDLGPITIRASMSGDGTRLEFFSATDGGREALKQALPELRREASASGLSASLDLGTGTPEEREDAAQAGAGRKPGPETRDEPDGVRRPAPPTPWTARPPSATSTLDLFA